MRSAAGVGGEVPGVDTVKGGEGGGGGGGVAGGVGGGVGVGAGGGGESVDPVRKELEGKDREIIDLKVSLFRSIASYPVCKHLPYTLRPTPYTLPPPSSFSFSLSLSPSPSPFPPPTSQNPSPKTQTH